MTATSKELKDEKRQLMIISVCVFISYIGTSLAYPIFPPLFLHPTPGSIIPTGWNESMRSIALGIALAAYPFGQFIGSPLLGACSDRYGRKPILVLSLGASAAGYLFSAIALYYNWLGALLLSRLLTGMMEGNIAIVRAMAADLVHISKYKSFGRINGLAAIGFVMGPLLGGFLSDSTLVPWFSYTFPFYLATLFSCFTFILSILYLVEIRNEKSPSTLTLAQRFNLVARYRSLFARSTMLKYLLMVSTTFTIAVDIFYEFGPVYLTGLWGITPSGIAIYNAALSFTLALGGGWLPQLLSGYASALRIALGAMLLTAIMFGLLVVWPSPILAFILFGLVGLSIATAYTTVIIQISNTADKTIQGEVMGAQLGLRMMWDAIICLVGGTLIISSVLLPLAVSCVVALAAAAGMAWMVLTFNSLEIQAERGNLL